MDSTQHRYESSPTRRTPSPRAHRFVRRGAMLLPALVPSLLLSACASTAGSRTTSADDPSHNAPTATASASASDVVSMSVHGFGCPLCATNVERALLGVRGVNAVEVDLGAGRVDVYTLPGAQPTRDQLARAVSDAGFTLVAFLDPKEAR